MKALIIEDCPDTAHMVHLILSRYGDCDIAEDGYEGLDKISNAWNINDPYDVIVLDVMMRNMNGLETLKILREKEEQRGMGGILGTKVVMLTALDDDDTVSEAVSLGCEGYVSKTQGVRKVIEKLKAFGIIPEDHEE